MCRNSYGFLLGVLEDFKNLREKFGSSYQDSKSIKATRKRKQKNIEQTL
jgi:hypothetical protein